MVGAGNTFFQIIQSMTAHHSGPGPDLSRVGVEGSHMIAWPQLCAKLVLTAMVEAIPAQWQPEGVTLPRLLEPFPVDWNQQIV
jgi:hypothetical protein